MSSPPSHRPLTEQKWVFDWQVVTLVLQRQDRLFVEYIPHFLPAFTQYALLDLDPSRMHLVRPKWRLLALAFLIRAAGDSSYTNLHQMQNHVRGGAFLRSKFASDTPFVNAVIVTGFRGHGSPQVGDLNTYHG